MKIVFAYFIKSLPRKIVVLRKGIIFFCNYNQFQTALFLPASTHFHHSSRWSLELYPTPIEVNRCFVTAFKVSRASSTEIPYVCPQAYACKCIHLSENYCISCEHNLLSFLF